tara:strand:- start:71 stop:451 length:381 start_codon:yes stop_codon:yes gene_type:complete
MNTTKHIKNLSKELTKNKEPQYREYLLWELTRIKNALLNGRFYAGVVSVSRSGMSRKIRLAYVYENRFITITDPQILKLAGVNRNGSISGCGMDMLFHAQYTLFHNLHRSYKRANYQNRLKPYKDY